MQWKQGEVVSSEDGRQILGGAVRKQAVENARCLKRELSQHILDIFTEPLGQKGRAKILVSESAPKRIRLIPGSHHNLPELSLRIVAHDQRPSTAHSVTSSSSLHLLTAQPIHHQSEQSSAEILVIIDTGARLSVSVGPTERITLAMTIAFLARSREG